MQTRRDWRSCADGLLEPRTAAVFDEEKAYMALNASPEDKESARVNRK